MAPPRLSNGPALASDAETEPAPIHPFLTRPIALLSPPGSWSRACSLALLALVIVWAVEMYGTWGAWGNLTIDSGHELYIPALLARGKTLYRDVWFMYGPAAPYFTSYLFRLFGVKLNVLYWAGSISALGSAILLYLIGLQLGARVAGWTAGALVLMEAFQPSLFCFPLPYTSAAVYGCFVGCLFLWLGINACASLRWAWTFAAGTAAAVALLLKPEFGMACYGSLALLLGARSLVLRSWKLLARDLVAALPGVALCGLVIRWMVSIAGVEFITQENLVFWPTSYFMKTFGKYWLATTGFQLTGPAFRDAFFRAVPVALAALTAYALLWWKRSDTTATVVKVILALVTIRYFARTKFLNHPLPEVFTLVLSAIFFPRDMVLYVILAACAAWCYFLLNKSTADGRSPAIPFLLTYSGLLAFRILMYTVPTGYAIFYNGPVLLGFFLLVRTMIPRAGRSRRFVFLGELAISIGCLLPAAILTTGIEVTAKDFVPFTTERGTVRVSKDFAENYRAAIQFMKAKAALGEAVLSIPEDTSLYFLSGAYCPTRVFSFTPGVLAPGKMTKETIQEIEQKHVQYLLWSNRIFPEYGVPVFGRDFDREVGEYLTSHYRRVGPVGPNTDPPWEWNAMVWERKPEAQSP